jgi:UDP-N-acetyl-D-galactosamine dehydrogenase
VDNLYNKIIGVGTHRASSIIVAEAAKIIENTQRDINIALMNELAQLFGRLGVDTGEVIEAARTKWNFLEFEPGLVGGHCIGVDPYYLTYKAQNVGLDPQVVLSGRGVNESMGAYVASRLLKAMAAKGLPISGGRVLILGFTFKENTPDLRNTRVIDIVHELEDYAVHVDVYDPWVDFEEAKREYGISIVDDLEGGPWDSVILAVRHTDFIDFQWQVRDILQPNGLVFDLKRVWDRSVSDIRL